MGVCFLFTRERLREEKEQRQEEGVRVGVGGEGDINPAECLGHYPLQR